MTDSSDKTELPDQIKRWTAKRRSALVLRILKGQTTVREAAREHGLKPSEVEERRDRFLAGAENNLRTNPRSEEQQLERENQKLKQKVGELVMSIDVLKEAMKPYGPFGQGTSNE